MTKPIVAWDAREIVGKRAGKGNTVYFVLKELLARDLSWTPLLYSKSSIIDPKLPPTVISRLIGGVRGFRFPWLAGDMARAGAHLAIIPTGYQVTPFMRIPYVLIVYDLVAFSSYARFLPWTTRWVERLMLPWAARHAKHIFVISEFTKLELNRKLGIETEKMTVMPLAADQNFCPAKEDDHLTLEKVKETYHLPDQFMLFVGTLEPRKNIAGLIRAYHTLSEDFKQATPLILVGRAGWLDQPVKQMISQAGEEKNIQQLDYVPLSDLPHLYQLATVCVYPSFYEGFGLPPLEAMACGCPVITSNVTAIPEVVGEAATLVDPNNDTMLARAMEEVVSNHKLRQDLRARGLKQAALFSWQKTADIIDRKISELIA